MKKSVSSGKVTVPVKVKIDLSALMDAVWNAVKESCSNIDYETEDYEDDTVCIQGSYSGYGTCIMTGATQYEPGEEDFTISGVPDEEDVELAIRDALRDFDISKIKVTVQEEDFDYSPF